MQELIIVLSLQFVSLEISIIVYDTYLSLTISVYIKRQIFYDFLLPICLMSFLELIYNKPKSMHFAIMSTLSNVYQNFIQ